MRKDWPVKGQAFSLPLEFEHFPVDLFFFRAE